MLKILVVDDERIERDGIKFLIDKYSLPLLVYEARNGKEAFNFIKENAIDILFTDIKMPFMDGLELSKLAKEILPSLKIVIYSAYSDFDYARRALSVQALDYVLKPVEEEEFKDTVLRVIELCRQNQINEENEKKVMEGYKKGLIYEKEKLLHNFIEGINVDEKIYSKAEELRVNVINREFQLILIETAEKFFDTFSTSFQVGFQEIIKNRFEFIKMDERHGVIFLGDLSKEQNKSSLLQLGNKLLQLINHMRKSNVYIVFGNKLNHIDNIHKEYERMEQTLEHTFFLETSTIFFQNENIFKGKYCEDLIEKDLKSVYECIELKDFASLDKNIDLLIEYIKGSIGYSSIYVKNIFIDIVNKLYENCITNNMDSRKENIEKILQCENVHKLTAIIKVISEYILSNNDCNDNKANKKVIQSIIKIIHKEYGNNIGLEYIAEKVYLSPGYLSSLFKKEKGISLTKYITNYRMEKAKEMLENTNIKVIDISKQVGYANQAYFCSLFKNYFEITPIQCRERVK